MEQYLLHSKGAWKKHKYIKKIGKRYIYKNSDKYSIGYTKEIGIDTGKDTNDDGYADRKGIRYKNDKFGKSISFYDTSNDTYWDNGEDVSKVNKKFGPLSIEYKDDGVEYKLDLNFGKTKIKDLDRPLTREKKVTKKAVPIKKRGVANTVKAGGK